MNSLCINYLNWCVGQEEIKQDAIIMLLKSNINKEITNDKWLITLIDRAKQTLSFTEKLQKFKKDEDTHIIVNFPELTLGALA